MTWLAIGTAAAGFSAPIDRRVTAHLAGAPAAQSLRSGNIIGGKEFQFGSALATYTLGRLTNNQRVTQVGSRLFRAQLVAQTVTGVIKHAAQTNAPRRHEPLVPFGSYLGQLRIRHRAAGRVRLESRHRARDTASRVRRDQTTRIDSSTATMTA